jgi:subtilisin family serine protease
MQSRVTKRVAWSRASRFFGGTAAALAVLLLLSSFHVGPDGAPFGPPRLAARASAADATPDCGNLPPDPHPALQRAKRLARLGVDQWHAAGVRGRGLKIAVLDSGFRGYRDHLGKALPAQVLTRSFRTDGNLEAKNSQHGILCAEVLHSLAPDAELLLANWDPERSDEFLAAARWAREQGAKVISCSVIMPSWSDGEGKGPVHDALSRILGPGTEPGDMLLFASAGNVAQRHWSGPFHDAGARWHEWATGVTDNEVSPWGKEQVSIEMCWQPGADYDLFVNETKTGRDIGHSVTRPGERRTSAVVRFLPHGNHTYQVRVKQAGGRPGSFHVSALGGGLQYSTAKGSITFPGDGPEVIAVGAVDSGGQRTGYSSCGPNSCRPKPDLVATVPFPSLWRPRPFTGTSAAAPQAAGLASLLWTRHPDWTANRIRDTLQKSARDLGPPGHDHETGYGLINLPK